MRKQWTSSSQTCAAPGWGSSGPAVVKRASLLGEIARKQDFGGQGLQPMAGRSAKWCTVQHHHQRHISSPRKQLKKAASAGMGRCLALLLSPSKREGFAVTPCQRSSPCLTGPGPGGTGSTPAPSPSCSQSPAPGATSRQPTPHHPTSPATSGQHGLLALPQPAAAGSDCLGSQLSCCFSIVAAAV